MWLYVIFTHHAVEKKKVKSFHVVLYICGSIYRAWCVLIPAETFSLPALWALIAGTEGHMQHYRQARLRTAEWHFPFMQKLTPNTGQKDSEPYNTACDPGWPSLKARDKWAMHAGSNVAAEEKGRE